MQTRDRFEETLHARVLQAYKPLFDVGGRDKSLDELRDYFTVTSSPSQAKNAARFFREVCRLAGLDRSDALVDEDANEADALGLAGELLSHRSGPPAMTAGSGVSSSM